MKKLLFVIAGILLFTGCAVQTAQSNPEPVKIVNQGKSDYVIVLPDRSIGKYTGNFLREGALALQSAMKEGTGVLLPVIRESALKPGQKAIFIGDCRATRAAGIDCSKFQDYNHLIAEKAGNIHLAGLDAPGAPGVKDHGNYLRCYLGSVKAVVSFMEKFLGTKILYPGENGRTTPKRTVITIPQNLKLEIKPPLIMGTGCHHELIYDMANNIFGYPKFYLYGGHSYYTAVPAKVYGKSHPEYFIQKYGKRDSKSGHLCISNPEVQNLIYLEAKKRLQLVADIVELSQTDGFVACDCEKCKTLYNVSDFGEKLWLLHRNIAERLYKEMPEKKVLIISYGPTARPPRTFKEFPPNTMIELCSYDQESLDAWSKLKVPQKFTSYIYNWGSYNLPGYTPVHAPEVLARQVKTFYDFGVQGVYRCGFGILFGLEGPIYYMYGKMWDDPSQDYNKLLIDFYQAAFMESALPMQQFYTRLYEQLRVYEPLAQELNPNRTGVSLNPCPYLAYVYTPEVLNFLENHLAQAERKASNVKVKKRLTIVRTEFEYVKNLARIIHFYHAYKFAPDRNGFEKIAAELEKRGAMINSFFDGKGHKKAYPGWAELKMFGKSENRQQMMTNGELYGTIKAPLNWDIPYLRKTGILPGTLLKKKCTAYRRRPGALEDFRAGAWKEIPFQTLGGIHIEQKIKLPTRFKLMYDKKNLYAAFEAILPANRTYTPQGRDSRARAHDCLEFVIDPFCGKDIYYHLLWNAVPDSCYDAVHGLIRDPLNPLYGKYDSGWNGKWSYRNFRSGDRWYSLLTIPYSTIRTVKPESGSSWLMNAARTDYGSRTLREIGNPELSLWSPNPESRTFHDPECFGEIIFE